MSYINIDQCDVSQCTEDGFIIDANALLYVFYPNISPIYAASYSNFVTELINEGKQIYIPMFSLVESVNVIEKTECKLYYGNSRSNHIKQYRRIDAEREKVRETIKLFLDQIAAVPNISVIPQSNGWPTINKFVDEYKSHKLDCFDYCIAELSFKEKYPIITNDADFTTSTFDIDIYTSNPNILQP